MQSVTVLKIKRKPCGFKNCKEPGLYTPQLMFPFLHGSNGKPLVVSLDIEVCEKCRTNPKQAFVSDEGYRHVLKLIRKNGYSERPAISDVVLQFETESGVILPWKGRISV